MINNRLKELLENIAKELMNLRNCYLQTAEVSIGQKTRHIEKVNSPETQERKNSNQQNDSD